MGKNKLLRNNFGIWDFNEQTRLRPSDAGKVN